MSPIPHHQSHLFCISWCRQQRGTSLLRDTNPAFVGEILCSATWEERGAHSLSAKRGEGLTFGLASRWPRPHLPHLPPSTNHQKEAPYKTLNEELSDGQWVSNNPLSPALLDMQKVVGKYSHERVLLFTEWVCWGNGCCQSWLINKNRIPKNNPMNSFPTENQDNKAISNDAFCIQLPFLGHR